MNWLKAHWIALVAVVAGLAAGGGIGMAGASGISQDTTTLTTTTPVQIPDPAHTVTKTVRRVTTVTHTVTKTLTTGKPLPPPPCHGADPCPPRGPSGADGTYNCSDFDTQQQAWEYVDQVGDIDGLDRNGAGTPCESLPG